MNEFEDDTMISRFRVLALATALALAAFAPMSVASAARVSAATVHPMISQICPYFMNWEGWSEDYLNSYYYVYAGDDMYGEYGNYELWVYNYNDQQWEDAGPGPQNYYCGLTRAGG